MNLRAAVHFLALNLLIISGAIGLVGAWSAYESWRGVPLQHEAMAALLSAAASGIALSGLTAFLLRSPGKDVGRREALLIVTGTWAIGAVLAALPYIIWARCTASPANPPHVFNGFASCYFEAMSGLTTAGSSVLTNIESMPRGLLFWRSLTHWLGGLGIVLLFVAVLANLGVAGKKLYNVEASPCVR
jgi:trk/ktr system potassium uptake protein